MGQVLGQDPGETTILIEQLRSGDLHALALLFDRYRARLKRMIQLRLDPRLRGQFDLSDVLQEAYLDVARDLPAFLADSNLNPIVWLRLHVGRRLTTLHRRHLGTRMRDASQEISIYSGTMPEASSVALAMMLLGHLTSPSQAVLRAERLAPAHDAVKSLDPLDREILALRHTEQLGRSETTLLRLSQEAGAKRYFRAIKRLKGVLVTLAGGLEDLKDDWRSEYRLILIQAWFEV